MGHHGSRGMGSIPPQHIPLITISLSASARLAHTSQTDCGGIGHLVPSRGSRVGFRG